MSSFMTCFGQDVQNTAKRLNTEIDNILDNMPSISDDTLYYYDNVVKLLFINNSVFNLSLSANLLVNLHRF